MLTALNIAQLVLYIALLALLGQGLLFILAGPKRDTNFFYRLLQVVSKPFTMLIRKITPKQVADQHVPIATFFLLLVAYAVVTLEKVQYCVGVKMAGCQ
jgi:cytochrome b561